MFADDLKALLPFPWNISTLWSKLATMEKSISTVIGSMRTSSAEKIGCYSMSRPAMMKEMSSGSPMGLPAATSSSESDHM